MDEQLYSSRRDEDRESNKPFVFAPVDDFEFKLRRSIISTQPPVITFDKDHQEGATEEDVMNRQASQQSSEPVYNEPASRPVYYPTEEDVVNRSVMMQTGQAPADTSEYVRQQVAAQQAAIDEANRLAARKAADEEQARLAAEEVQRQQEESDRQMAILRSEAADAERLRQIDELARQEAQRISDEAVTRRSVGEQAASTPGEAISVDLAYAQDVVRNAGGDAQQAAAAAAETVAAQEYIQAQTQAAAAQQQAVQEWALKGEAGAVDQSGTDVDRTTVGGTPTTPSQQAFAEAAVVQQKTEVLRKEAETLRQNAITEDEKKYAEEQLKMITNVQKSAKNVINSSTSILQSAPADGDDIFDKIAKWIIKTVKL